MANYKVGYCKPPKETQFQKGKSGNPSGGRKKPASIPEMLREGLSKTIQVVDNGERKTITRMEAVINRLIDKSIVGDMNASRLLLGFAQVLNESPSVSSSELDEHDKQVLASLYKTFESKSES